MPRLFTALEIPDDLAWSLSLLRAGVPGAQWIDPDNYHVTMRFAGDMSERTAAAFADALANIQFDSFEVEVSGLGSFGGHKPRAIWVALKPSTALENLQKAHERAARLAGLPPEPRNFVPHVTLARLRNGRADFVAEFLARHGAFRADPFIVSHFALVSSRPNYGGGPYVIEEAFEAVDARYAEEWDEAVA